MELSQEWIDWILTDFLQDVFYDVLKVILGFIAGRVLYENVYIKYRWGGWKIRIQNGVETLLIRDISPEKAQHIMNDGSDFAVYVKGVASPYFWINQRDMSLEQVNKTDFLTLDKEEKMITIDQAHNPSPKKGVSNEQLLVSLQAMEKRLEVLSTTTSSDSSKK